MANITPYVSQILSAIYGEEVRGSIVNALNAMNNDINIDMVTLRDLESKTRTSATNAANSATAASNSANSANTAATNAANSATAASNSANSANTAATNAANSATAASTSAGNASAYAYESKEALKIIQELMSLANFENIYKFVREKIWLVEGYFADRSIEDSSGDSILDRNGNPIEGRKLLDPSKFADIYEYVMLFFMKEDNLQKFIDTIKYKIYDFVFQNILSNEKLYGDIYKYVLNNLYRDLHTIEITDDVLDSDGDELQDSDMNTIIGRRLLFIKG